MVEGIRVDGGKGPNCPYCRDVIERQALDKTACRACMAWHHQACWDELGRCAACEHQEPSSGTGRTASSRARAAPPALDKLPGRRVGDFDLTTAQADQLAEELRGERLLWAGTGSAAPKLPLGIQLHTTGGETTAGRAATTCFAIPWTAFALFWMAMASQASWLFAMFGLPFVLIGLMMLFGPWLGPRLQRPGKTSIYAVTERRALILGEDGVQSFPPERLGHVQRRRRGALSDLIFARELEQSGAGVGQVERGFLGVADAEAALTVLEALKASAS